MCLGLDRTPAAEVIQLTAAVWLEAITEGREFDQQLDAPRFRRAFAVLCRDCRQWPLPSSLLEAMPPREQMAITKQPIKANPERAEQAARELASFLGVRK
jgi:hypothetical protein